mgnify:CR=1 FL=1
MPRARGVEVDDAAARRRTRPARRSDPAACSPPRPGGRPGPVGEISSPDCRTKPVALEPRRARSAAAGAPLPTRRPAAPCRCSARAARARAPTRCRSAATARDTDRSRATETAAPTARRRRPRHALERREEEARVRGELLDVRVGRRDERPRGRGRAAAAANSAFAAGGQPADTLARHTQSQPAGGRLEEGAERERGRRETSS